MDDRLVLAIKYYQSNLDDQAWALVAEMVDEPDPPSNVLSLAATLSFERGEFATAIDFCDRFLALQPDDGPSLLIKGRALSDLGRHAEALVCLKHATAADHKLAAAHYTLGWVHQSLGDRDAAITAYRAAVSRRDPYPVAWNNLGLLLERAGDGDGAVNAFRTVIKQSPAFSAAHNNLGAVLAAGGRFHAAEASYIKAMEADPENLDARVNLGVARLEQGDIDGATEAFDTVLAIDPSHAAAIDNRLYANIYRRDDDLLLSDDHNAAGNRSATPKTPDDLISDPDPNRPLKVGFLSPDFRRHSVSFFSLPLIEALDRAQIEVFLFSTAADPDHVTARFKSAANHWQDIAALTDGQVSNTLRAAHLDCIVDLAGRTTGNRLRALAGRVAPVQITALGYPGPSGLPAMDYWLCDAVTNPPGADDSLRRDRPLRLDRGLHVFAPPEHAPDVGPVPVSHGDAVTFGSFNKLAKVSDATVNLWTKALQAVPESRLLLKARALTEPETVASVLKRFERAGLDPARIEARGWALEDQDHLALYNRVDIALDTAPYNGTTTTCEALWMGVPVLTLCGHGHAARVGASLLTSAGLTGWICETPEAFAETAQVKALDQAGLTDLRAGLRTQLRKSPLTNGTAVAWAFVQALRTVWNVLCA